ncbi:hypothetical protein CLOM_g10859 [Closterium sp. NIES-68]|nr:hypothetical protein CLOM_g10859 [Closterium sp. NIES-68]GJP74816.1 hypothetical protein CLOP_g5350 [Closterium sp. NIES-67]
MAVTTSVHRILSRNRATGRALGALFRSVEARSQAGAAAPATSLKGTAALASRHVSACDLAGSAGGRDVDSSHANLQLMGCDYSRWHCIKADLGSQKQRRWHSTSPESRDGAGNGIPGGEGGGGGEGAGGRANMKVGGGEGGDDATVVEVDRSGLKSSAAVMDGDSPVGSADHRAGSGGESSADQESGGSIPAGSPMVEHIRSMIRFRGGPVSVADYMEQVLTSSSAGGYYMQRDVFGREGDFITSPEISQMFGEMVAVWAMMAWQQLGSPPRVRVVELGPGRGTLMADLLRSSAKFAPFSQAVEVHLVEVSPALRRLQWAALKCHAAGAEGGREGGGGEERSEADGGRRTGGGEEGKAGSGVAASAGEAAAAAAAAAAGAASPSQPQSPSTRAEAAEAELAGTGVSGLSGATVTWHSALEDVPEGVPTILIAHEFFDALPIHQFQKTDRGWCEKLVDVAEADKQGHPSEGHSDPSHAQGDTSGRPSADHPFRFVLSPGPTAACTLCLLPRMQWAPLEERGAAEHVEVCPVAVKIALQITERVARDGGAALIVDYGEDRLISDSLQAIRKHEFVNVFDAPGTADLSAYVDFAAIRQAVADSKLPARAFGPITQSQLLGRLGINFRVETLLRVASEQQAEALRDGYWRLVGDGEPPWLDEDDEREAGEGGGRGIEGEDGAHVSDCGSDSDTHDGSFEKGGNISKRSFVGMGLRYKALVIASERLGVPVGFE